VAPVSFAQKGRCWRMISANPVGQATVGLEPVAWIGRWKLLRGQGPGEGVVA
jgi:hypothetical protein